MYEFHRDKERYFKFTAEVTEHYIFPFIEQCYPIQNPLRVLEIGCGEGGVLKAFLDKGHSGTGIELVEARMEKAKNFLREYMDQGKVDFLNRDIYLIDPDRDLATKYDIVILKDVIEHIPQQERFVPELHKFLNPGGVVFFGFPPWLMPFGGHQQMLTHKVLSKTPYFHLLPWPLYRSVLKMAKESNGAVRAMKEIKDTGITIERFEKIVDDSGFKIINRKLYLTNPIYQYKFGLKTRKQLDIIASIPYIRDFVSTAAYYLIGK